MKYFGDLARISLFVLMIYFPMSWWSVRDTLERIETSRIQDTAQRISNAKNIVDFYIKDARYVDACQRLDAEFAAGTLTAYNLKTNDLECFKKQDVISVVQDKLPLGKFASHLINSSLEVTYFKQKNAEVEWVVAAAVKSRMGLWDRIQSDPLLRDAIIKDVLIVLYIIFAFIFCGVLILAESIQNQFRRRGQDPTWLKVINKCFGWLQLHDLKIIRSANAVMIKKTDDLIKDQELLETSLEFSILNEIRTHQKQVPYAFLGTVVKVDINGFSKVIASGHRNATAVLTTKLEDFGCELLQRYGGLFEKTVGDEIVVVFKNQSDTSDSALRALAFARDLMREFSNEEFEFSGEKRKFTLKAGISDSQIVFSKRAPGYGFSGDALTYTTRLLDVVKLKDRNIVSCLLPQAALFKNLVSLPEKSEIFEFKNMPQAEGYLIDQFLEIEIAYEKFPELLKYYKSDRAIYFLLDQIQKINDLGQLKNIFQCLSQIQVRVCSNELVTSWMNTVVAVQNKKESLIHFEYILAQIIMVGSNLIPNEKWDESCIQIVLNVPRQIQGRINASIVELLSNKKLAEVVVDHAESFIIPNDQSFRTRGNLLINQAVYQLNEDVLSDLHKMLISENNLEMATGLFAAGQIIAHFEATNPASLQTFRNYKKVMQALIQIQQTKSEQISDRLTKILNQTLKLSAQL